jgi:hypothetical protein
MRPLDCSGTLVPESVNNLQDFGPRRVTSAPFSLERLHRAQELQLIDRVIAFARRRVDHSSAPAGVSRSIGSERAFPGLSIDPLMFVGHSTDRARRDGRCRAFAIHCESPTIGPPRANRARLGQGTPWFETELVEKGASPTAKVGGAVGKRTQSDVTLLIESRAIRQTAPSNPRKARGGAALE